MDSTIPPTPPPPIRPDVVAVETTPRPTPRTVGAPFSEVLAGGARAFVRGATAAAHSLPGSPLMAVAIRGGFSAQANPSPAAISPEGPGGLTNSPGLGGPTGMIPGGLVPGGTLPGGLSGGTTAGGTADGSATGTNDPSITSTLAQDQEMNLYYLQIQEQVNAQNRTYSALSNVIEVEHNTAKTAIGNIH
jgi:hypothetical protein